jgi:hypothetical protein
MTSPLEEAACCRGELQHTIATRREQAIALLQLPRAEAQHARLKRRSITAESAPQYA